MALTFPKTDFSAQIAKELNLRPGQVQTTIKLLSEGATVPFLARYRKEATGSLDEVVIAQIRDRLLQLGELESRRESILKSLKERNLLTEELGKSLNAADTLHALEDIYAPFRPKRRTRATIAKERGLEPLAEFLLNQQGTGGKPKTEAANYINAELEVPDVEAALAGARDIIAERVSDETSVRSEVRRIFEKEGTILSKVIKKKETEADAAKFRDYFDWSEKLESIPSHRLLAIRRGEKEGFLRVQIEIPQERGFRSAERHFVTANDSCGHQVALAAEDGCKRLLFPSMETEMRVISRKKADEEAVRVFADNLRELLLASPLGQKRVLALDPGFRTGCKTVCLDAQGQLLTHDVIHIIGSPEKLAESAAKLKNLIQQYKIEAIAIGNGTASRETESFVKKLGLPSSLAIVMVNESGASIYSASEVARREFPDHDVTVRGAASIGRRLMDPLAELVKLDPKSIGVGQYQHDVDQNLLKSGLDDCVMSCVNAVGVEVNTASPELLSYVSGLSSAIADNIVAYRNENGPFQKRSQLKKVPRFGEKAFEQAAGFLRIRDAKNPLDASAVHPERYKLVETMAKDAGCKIEDLLKAEELRKQIQLEKYVGEDVGLPTLRDIFSELAKPGRDPRKAFEVFSFAEGVEKPEDLREGMRLPGIVTNVTKFGAFVDIGVHQDGLVHISQLADKFVEDPADVVKVNQKVQVTVLEVDLDRKRISLTMKSERPNEQRSSQERKQPRRNDRSKQNQNRNNGGNAFGGDWFDAAIKK
tara:strand:- start:2595 stop:4886 length:2292 start_codon:yes stop_codon:yes gene_type:complete